MNILGHFKWWLEDLYWSRDQSHKLHDPGEKYGRLSRIMRVVNYRWWMNDYWYTFAQRWLKERNEAKEQAAQLKCALESIIKVKLSSIIFPEPSEIEMKRIAQRALKEVEE